MDFDVAEDRDGVRLTWNNVPQLRLQHLKNVVPLTCLYSPLRPAAPVLPSLEISRCRQCKAFVNPYAIVLGEMWLCQFCLFMNRSTSAVPAYSTVEYDLGRASQHPPIYLYVVDTCFEGPDVEDAFALLIDGLAESLENLPEGSLVGLVSFGKHVFVHDLANQRLYAFNGDKEYTLEDIKNVLDITREKGLARGTHNFSLLEPIESAETSLLAIFDNLNNNAFPHKTGTRLERATGCAMRVAALCLQAVIDESAGGRMLCFIGGAATYGPGKIVGTPLKEPMRLHHDIERVSAYLARMDLLRVAKVDVALHTLAKAFYAQTAQILVRCGMSCDVFVGLYDQVGLFEMEAVCSSTGGTVVMCDSFGTAIFRQSFLRFMATTSALNASLEVRVPDNLKVQGLIGHALPLELKKEHYAAKSVLDQAIGHGNTISWKLCLVDPQLTYALYFDKLDLKPGHTFVQFIFYYQHLSEMRLRVTTVPLSVVADGDLAAMEHGFDQTAALVACARQAFARLNLEGRSTFDHHDVEKHLDKLLVDFCKRFGLYTKGVSELFQLSSQYSLVPTCMYHLRRLPFVRVFNNSPDETSFIKHAFMHEDTNNCMVMMQPTLFLYDIELGSDESDFEVVHLDLSSLGATKILLLDTFFHILIFHGSTVAQWRNSKYHELEEYEYFRDFLEAPKREAMEILSERFPLPRFISCDEGGSQARFLMAKLNPSTTYSTVPGQLDGQQVVKTDDKLFQEFMLHIQRHVVGK